MRLKRISLAIAAGAAVPASVYLLSWGYHRLSFVGVCGPHAPDIAAHPCNLSEYMAEYSAGFAGVGLFLIAIGSLPVGLVIALLFLAAQRRS